VDPAFALLYEHVSAADPSVRLHAIMGLAIAYAGTQKEQVRAAISCLRAMLQCRMWCDLIVTSTL